MLLTSVAHQEVERKLASTLCQAKKTIRLDFSIKTITSKLSLLFSRHRQRKQLLRLSEQALLDIGITADEAKKEARKSFWSGVTSDERQ